MAVLEPKFRCPKCLLLHSRYDSARECCEPDISEVWLCPLCGSEHFEEELAIECCDFDPNGPPLPPTAEELEAAGQVRLF